MIAKKLQDAKIPVTVVPCAALGYVIERVDMVLVGAEAVVESGGIVNKLGTYPMAMVAKLFNKPVYCAVESYKFARVFPLTQADIPKHTQSPLIPPTKVTNLMGTTIFASSSEGDVDDDQNKSQSHNEREEKEKDISIGQEEEQGPGQEAGIGLVNGNEENENENKREFKTENPACDYTPASYLTLLFTDLGILTPAAVSDELIRLYQ